jgi:hypothetical protein
VHLKLFNLEVFEHQNRAGNPIPKSPTTSGGEKPLRTTIRMDCSNLGEESILGRALSQFLKKTR